MCETLDRFDENLGLDYFWKHGIFIRIGTTMARKLNARTEGLRNFVQMALNKVKAGDMAGAELLLIDLWNDIGSSYVCVNRKPKLPGCPIPKYNPKKDGDYHAWLVAHNCD
jgi:hypothetical protein